MSELKKFFAGQEIFITGTTGFMGKALLEKLLRSCPEIKAIYILVRAKRGKSAGERTEELIAEPVFDLLRTECPDFAKKIISISGNISEDGLGLSVSDRDRVVNNVSVIFHLAATVRFNEELDVAVAMNTNSVKQIVDIAKASSKLMAAVYISTAYSHCVRNQIREEVYPAPMSYEAVNKLIESTTRNKFSEAAMDDFTGKVLGEWPNTYTFTKAIGESIVAEEAKELPFAIFRPSIVTNAYEEPFPGWISGLVGLHGMFYGMGLGLIHTGLLKPEAHADIVPVDYVCNALICCAWETAVTKRRNLEDIPVYNYTSGSENPITWKKLFDSVDIYARIFPTSSAIYYPSGFPTNSKFVFFIMELFCHIIPALISDGVQNLFGKEPKFYKLACQVGNACRALGYFSMKQWDFENYRVQNLWQRLTPEDKKIFPFSMRNIDWDCHCLRIIKGLRKFLWRDPDGNEEEARRRHVYLYIIHTALRLALCIFILWITWKIFCNRGISSF